MRKTSWSGVFLWRPPSHEKCTNLFAANSSRQKWCKSLCTNLFVHHFFAEKQEIPRGVQTFSSVFSVLPLQIEDPKKKFVRRFVCTPLLLGKPKFRQVPELCSACFSISPHGKDLESIKRQFVDLPLSLEKFRWVTKMCVSVFLGFMARQRLRKSSNAHVSMCRLLYKKRASRWQLVIFIRSQSPWESAWQLFASRLL